MSSVKLNHALGGSTTLEAGNTASAETITLPAGNNTLATETQFKAAGGRKNLIINGAMQVWQRGTSATGLTATDFTTVDRFMANYGGGSSAGTRSVERSTDTPSGFNYSIKITHSGSSTVPNEYAIRTFLEMQDVKHLIGNTAVFSFYYKSNRTGTHAYRFSHNGITGASSINGEFTVNSADTWERKEIVITQLQNATGTATSDTSWGIHLDCGPILYGEGLASFDDGDYFAVTGVQLEVGSVATDFEHRSYGEELALCQRYYQKSYNDGTAPGTITILGSVLWLTSQQWGVTSVPNGPVLQGYVTMPVELRAAATVVPYSTTTGTANRFVLSSTGSDVTPHAWLQQAPSTIHIGYPQNTGGAGFGNADMVRFHWTADAEL